MTQTMTAHDAQVSDDQDTLTETAAGERTLAATTDATKIDVSNLNAYFSKAQVLNDISLRVEQHRVTAVIGPSGCGKSTFVRCLNRMHEVTPGATVTGKVSLDGLDIYGETVDPVRIRRRVGMVFQKPNPFPTKSIRDNVLAGLHLNGAKIADPAAVVEETLTQVALWSEVKDRLDKSGASLSGGQQQRLCIARCLALKPEVILMDEPCSALDPIATARIEKLIHELRDRYTFVIVTHNMQQAARVADYTAFFYMGSLIEFDKTDVIFTNPRERRTEDYITGRFG